MDENELRELAHYARSRLREWIESAEEAHRVDRAIAEALARPKGRATAALLGVLHGQPALSRWFRSLRGTTPKQYRIVGGAETPVRHLTAQLPEQVPVSGRLSLIVGITATPDPASPAQPLPVLAVPPEGVIVTVVVSAPGLVALGELEQDLRVLPDGDPNPVRFAFRADVGGLHVVTVHAYRGGTYLAELSAQVSVETDVAVVEGPQLRAGMTKPVAEPGEVTLQVNPVKNGYSFQLLGETVYKPEMSRVAGDVTKMVNEIAAELKSMAAGKSPYKTPAAARDHVRELGIKLWAQAVPEAVRRQFWEQSDRIGTFTITSDLDVVPWELLYPADHGQPDLGFLAGRFPVLRRVYGQPRAPRLRLGSAAYIVPPGSPTNATDEVTAIRKKLGSGIEDRGLAESLIELKVLLGKVPDVLHFASHNGFDATGSSIKLADAPWTPTDLTSAVQFRTLAAATPLVFMNACRSAGEVMWLTDMIGWAKQFVQAGAGAFIGTLWAVRSSTARLFAEALYDALVCQGLALGPASLAARLAVEGEHDDPTWLAYSVYGNPGAKLTRVEDAA